MKRYLLVIALLTPALPAHATTWHIRLDGGTATQCTGTTNAAYPGSGSGVACAYNHPFWMVNQSTGAWTAFTSGDTMEFDDPATNTTPYYMGIGLNGLAPPSGSNAFCPSAVLCMLPVLPSGVTIKGQNTGSCHNSGHTALNFPTILSGLNGVFEVLNLQGTNNVTIECVAVTSPDTCNQLLNGSSQGLAYSSLSGGTATYVEYVTAGSNNPLPTQRMNVTSTHNAALTLTNQHIATFALSTWNITSTQATSSTTAVYGYTVTSGDVPRVGQTVFAVSGTTNGGGQFNTSFGNGTISASSGTTSGTFTVTGSGFSVVGSASESGSGIDYESGTSTVTGVSGTVSAGADAGTMVPAGTCTSANNYVQHGIRFEYLTGQGPANLVLTDVGVVGMTQQGILGSHLNVTGSDTLTANDIYVIGNGLSGWDSDGGGCGTSCEDVGTLNLTHVFVAWNGCMAVKPYNFNLPVSSNAFDLCYAQQTQGYGDGFSFIAGAAVTLNVNQSTFEFNTQDGLDSAHLGDDLTTNPITVITNSQSIGNMGQTFKMGAGLSSTAISNFSSGNCRFLVTASNVPGNPAGWAAGTQNSADSCRASGDEWALSFKPGQTVTLENNTSTGQGATMYDAECFPGQTCGTTTSFIFRNNISKGYTDPQTGQVAAGLFFGGGFTADPFTFPGSLITHNIWHTMRNPSCPQDASEVSCNYTDPLLVSEATVDTVNPALTSSSPAISAGTTPAPSTDYNGTTQTSPPTIGAFVFGSSSTVATPTASPVAGTYSSTQSVTLSTSTGGATICYTTDGTTPTASGGSCTHGTAYSVPITVSITTTIQAIGTLSGDTNSGVASFPYTITGSTVHTLSFGATLSLGATVSH